MAKKKNARLSPEEKGRRVYRERNLILKSMGFESYAVYLKSDLWEVNPLEGADC